MNKPKLFKLAIFTVAGVSFFLCWEFFGQKIKGTKSNPAYIIVNELPKKQQAVQNYKLPLINNIPMQTSKNSDEKIIAYSANFVKIIDKLDISSVDQFDIISEKNSPVTLFNKLIDKLLIDRSLPDSEKAFLIWELLGKYNLNTPIGLKLLDVLASVNGGRYFSNELMNMFVSPLTKSAAQANIAYVLSGMLRNPQFYNDKSVLVVKDFISHQFYATNDKNVLKALFDFSASSFGSEDGISDNTFALSVLESKKNLLTEAEQMSYRLAFTSPTNISDIVSESFGTKNSLKPEVQNALYLRLKNLSAFTFPSNTAQQVLDDYLNRNQPSSTIKENGDIQQHTEWFEMKAIANSSNRQDYQNYLFEQALASTDTVEKASILSLAIRDAEDLENPELLNRLLTSTTIQQDIEEKLSISNINKTPISEFFKEILSKLK